MAKLVTTFAWFASEDDYDKLKTIFTDSDALPSTYNEWLNSVETGIKEYTARGYVVEKVNLDPVAFPDWCRSKGLNIDINAREKFVNEVVARKYGAKK